uniref:Cytoplasmic dynein 2 heavy chain 1 n=1 Tax=Ascaris lumbricoides TaxID=6252 RepID=A0A9J2Q4R6_ASCLU
DLLTVHEKITANIEALKSLNARAQGEVTIREAIQELELWAAQTEFTLTEYKHTNGSIIKVIKDWKDSINSVKDTEALLQSLKNSPYYAQFIDKTSIWETRLADLDQYLQWMNEIQRKWIYLEPIFGRGSLPSEASRFNRVDVEFRTILNEVARDSRLVSLCSRQYLRRTLEQIIDQLNRCQRALNQFLEEKRSAFPRFYFLGDDDLLEILGQSTNPIVIQAHLKKLFQGINKVVFGEANQTLVAIVSAHGERVQLSKPVRIVPQVEIWLQELSNEMKSTIRLLTIDCLRQASLDPGKYPSQVLCLAEQIRFCRDCENALDKTRDLKQFQSELKQQLAAYTSSRVEDFVLDLKLKSLILDLIHHINIVDELIKENASNSSCWFWQKQLRFYLDTNAQHIVIRQVNAKFDYTYEYQGNAPKLVHTPLTDKCYLTLTQAMSMGLGGNPYGPAGTAMSMGLGGNPYGPAGTGKTESVKALGNLFARQVLVFNCDEGIDVHSMSRIFVGLVQCGAWGCFDEFNRLDQTVLSAVSMQVQTIQNAIKSRSGVCSLGNKQISVDSNSAIFITLNPAGKGYGGRQKLPDNLKQLFRPVAMSVPDNELIAETILYSEGFKEAKVLARKLISVDSNSAIFITLNPAGKGYGGRQKLPDNLKQLFRPVAMSVPDNELIAETILYSEGFKEAKVLARKLVTIFNLTREMLSQQQHYDWGLRALKTVLRGCGDMLTANPTGDERQIALLLNTLSKLTFADSSRFNVLVDDVFTDVKKGTAQFDDLIEALKRVSDEMKITITDIQKRKIFELYEQMRQRMGVVLVGPSGCGKSTLWRVLKRALAIVNKPVTTYTINPKAISRTKLLGYMDLDTREWFDGVLTAAAREVVKDSSVDAWIVCDGDIDPEWVEALNSVLDDNRLLTMPSGERIQFGANVNFLFETDDLSCASPATVSRMEDMDAREIVKAWLREEEEDAHIDLQQWIDDHLYRCLKWIWDKNEYEIKVSRTATVYNALCHLRGVKSREEFLVGLYRGLSSNLNQEARNSFAQDVVFSGITLPDPRSPSNVCYDSRLGSIISYTDDTTVNISLEEMQHEERRPYILTAAAQAARDTVCSWLRSDNRQPFIVFGPDGCGKESLLRYCFQTDPNSQVAVLHCSAQTSAEHLLQVLAQHCVQVSSTSGRVLKPKEKANLIVYLKALNLVKPDKWGTCELVAFLQQMLTYRGYYDEKLEWIGLENIQVLKSGFVGILFQNVLQL